MSYKYIYIIIFISLFSNKAFACDEIDVMFDINHVSCYGNSDANIEVIPTNLADNLPYTYSFNGSVFSPTKVFNNLSAGSYSIIIKDNTGCEETFNNIIINQPDSITLELIPVPIKCGDDGILYPQVSGGVGPYLFEWNNDPMLKMDTLRNINGGVFSLKVQDQNKCIKTKSIELLEEDAFKATIQSNQTEINIGESVLLTAELNRVTGNYSYQWYPDYNLECFDCKETSIQLFESAQITLNVHDLDNGCVDTDSINITVKGEFSLFIPNAFSPNNDGKNDIFYIYGVGVDQAHLKVYDANGFLVFEGDALQLGWDGTASGYLLEEGIYFYHADIKYADSSKQEYKGQITLLR